MGAGAGAGAGAGTGSGLGSGAGAGAGGGAKTTRRFRASTTIVPETTAKAIIIAAARLEDPILNFVLFMLTATHVSNVWMSLRSKN